MKIKEALCIGGNFLQYLTAFSQTEEIFQIIELVLSLITTLIILIFKIISWYKEAKKDGEITAEEMEEGTKIIMQGSKELEDTLKQGENKHDKI